MQMQREVVVVIGAGGIGIATARRQGFGKHILLAEFNEPLLATAARGLELASYKVSTCKVDVSSRDSVRALADEAASLGSVMQVINTAGVSPNMAPPGRILAVDLYGSAVVFEESERVIAPWLPTFFRSERTTFASRPRVSPGQARRTG